MNYRVSGKLSNIEGMITVPASKSISNRLLIIQALCNNKFNISNLSTSEDTRVLVNALQSPNKIADIGHAGTSMRFLTAFYASNEGEKILTGSDRMKERPIGNLVNALKKLGAEIEYTEKEGFPPLLIKGKQLNGGSVNIDSSVSSQFISALLLSSPTFKNGLELELENKVISSSYIEMTLKLMAFANVKVEKQNNKLIVRPQNYSASDIEVEGDWSGVSYWYQIAALASKARIEIKSLKENSLQGDAQCAAIFAKLNIKTEYLKEGIRIYKEGTLPEHFDFDFLENPDLVQTLAVTCVMLKIPFQFTGTQSLRIKETDRILALQNELGKFGVLLKYTNDGTLSWDGTFPGEIQNTPIISTYHDHRMALAFAPIAATGNDIIINDPGVVIKSYPSFWEDLKKLGFEIIEES